MARSYLAKVNPLEIETLVWPPASGNGSSNSFSRLTHVACDHNTQPRRGRCVLLYWLRRIRHALHGAGVQLPRTLKESLYRHHYYTMGILTVVFDLKDRLHVRILEMCSRSFRSFLEPLSSVRFQEKKTKELA